MTPLPRILVHVRITAADVDLPETEALRDAIVATVAAHAADQYGVRIKRRIVGLNPWRALWRQYQKRAFIETYVDGDDER